VGFITLKDLTFMIRRKVLHYTGCV